MNKNWKAYYESHTMRAEEAVAKIHDGDTVVDAITCGPSSRRRR